MMGAYLVVCTTAFLAFFGVSWWVMLPCFVALTVMSINTVRTATIGSGIETPVHWGMIAAEALPHNLVATISAYLLGFFCQVVFGLPASVSL
ncbi:MAG: hypothetical protein JXQ99_04165 [Hyphomicrobiaceae bacterium]